MNQKKIKKKSLTTNEKRSLLQYRLSALIFLSFGLSITLIVYFIQAISSL